MYNFAAGARHLINDVRLLHHWEGIFYSREKIAEGGPGPEHRSDVVVPAYLPDPLANACYGMKAVEGFSDSLLFLSSSFCRGAETDRTKDRG